MPKSFLKAFFINMLIILLCPTNYGSPAVGKIAADTILTGFRASRVLSSYPNNEFPFAEYWIRSGNRMSQKFPGTDKALIWIVSLYHEDGNTELSFPAEGKSYPDFIFSEEDFNETYLDSFDQAGIKVFLQVEPGNANTDTLINLVLNRYKHHSCIAGFGIDVEYNQKSENPNSQNYYGTRVTNLQASRWEALVKSHNPDYALFLKHFFSDWMPPDYRGNIIFVDDSQEFASLEEMVEEFIEWGESFTPNKVWFQFGYESDEIWWDNMNDPSKEIGQALLNTIPNTWGLFWVDFTITKVFPTSIKEKTNAPGKFNLFQNFPNPFNPATIISWNMSSPGNVELKVYDVLGNEIKELVNEWRNSGVHDIMFDGASLAGGIYFYRLLITNENSTFTFTRKLTLIK